MERRLFLKATSAALLTAPRMLSAEPDEHLPQVPPLEERHFPSRMHLFVWRNWELANLDRMAAVTGATARQVEEVGLSMGLPPKRRISGNHLRRSYVTVIRQNWHVLPESQIMQLLGWDETNYRFTLKEDDFLEVKLGRVKPACDALRYSPPDARQTERAREIRQSLANWFGDRLSEPGEDRFAFVNELSLADSTSLRNPGRRARDGEIDLGSGWTIAAGGSDATKAAAARLREFLGMRMGVRVGEGGASSKRLLLLVSPEQTARGGYRIRVRSEQVILSAGDAAGLFRAVHCLQSQMEEREGPFLSPGDTVRERVWSPDYLYSYFALYGDPLMDGDAAGLPDGYLERAARCGVDGVWIQAVLNTLAPAKAFPEFGGGWQTRLKNLRMLAGRAANFGIKIYLYLNEPRAMPAPFFSRRPEIRGSKDAGVYAMCTSTQTVRDWIRASLGHIFQQVPELGGIFTITMSENQTNCFSHGGAWGDKYPLAAGCPRCSERKAADAIAELIQTFRDGVREQSRTADIISYDWGWGTPLSAELIPKLPMDTAVLSISEWDQPVFRGGVHTRVGEYSMSAPGPGPRARANWTAAKTHGLATIAKMQFNNTWEISAVPYIPVLPLVLEHCEQVAKLGIGGVMASWTCGGYPSPNLRAAAHYAEVPHPGKDEILEREATRMYGERGAKHALAAWLTFSDAFIEFPYGVSLYVLPTQHGPANLFRLRPTGLMPGMILFPYDAYKSWSGAYPPSVVQSQMSKLAAKWKEGLPALEEAVKLAPEHRQREARRELALARTCYHHFQSTANQVEFYILRDALQTRADGTAAKRRLAEIVREEMTLAKEQYFATRAESLIAYEASNHYYYTPLDLVEKLLNCDDVLTRLESGDE